MARKVIGAGQFDCPMCGRTVRFVVDIEADTDGHLYSSRAKGISDDHEPTCKAYELGRAT